jgi:ADP-heptose:LPS heptosyltransferase
LIQSLRERYPSSYIAYLGEKNAVELLKNNCYLDKIIGFDFNLTFLEHINFIRNLRKEKFDVIIDLFGNPRSAILSFLSGAKIRVGGDFKVRGKLFTHRVKNNDIKHNAIEHHLRFIKLFGITPTTYKTKIFLKDEEITIARKFLIDEGVDFTKKVIGIYPGATWPAKRWFPEKFAELADSISKDLNYQVVFLQDEKDSLIIQNIKINIKLEHKFLKILSLREIASIIKIFDIFIANDCGLLHIAPAVGNRTIGLFGPGEEDIWFPYNEVDGCIAIRKDIWCHPCHLDFCDRMDCWKLLNIEEIISKIKKLFY